MFPKRNALASLKCKKKVLITTWAFPALGHECITSNARHQKLGAEHITLL